MRIAFDLDDTLIPTTEPFQCGSCKLNFPLSLFFKEELRIGTVELMKTLKKNNEIWIYTTSLRNPHIVKLWFYLWGIKVDSVINAIIHKKAVYKSKFSQYSKAPELFNIDILIDDSKGVQLECDKQNIKSIFVDPSDIKWTKKILKEIN